MKKILSLAVCTLMMLQAGAQCTLRISATSDSKLESVLLTYDGRTADTLTLNKGKWEANINPTEHAEGYLILTRKDDGGRDIQYLKFVPDTKAEIKINAKDYTLGGSEFYKQAGEVLPALDQLENDYRTDITRINKEMENESANNDSLKNVGRERYQTYITAREQVLADYATAHPNSQSIVLWLPFSRDYKAVVACLNEETRTQGYVAEFIKEREAEEAVFEQKRKALEEARKQVADGAVAPDFTLKDINGNDFTLSSLRGKYVVLDFWGSWCGWCIKGMPRMKEYYAKYNDRLEIVGIDCNDSDEKWRAAVSKHELPWIHVYNPRESQLLTTYAIEGFPTKFIIDPQGNIVRMVVGESDEFYEFIDETLQK